MKHNYHRSTVIVNQKAYDTFMAQKRARRNEYIGWSFLTVVAIISYVVIGAV